uniref:DUF4200 domain-containing protein n=2 Tax=Mesocestoides corti TaxID=53468 RepID=A0A5K3EK20_MESCO
MVMKTSDTDKPCSQLCVSEYLSARRKEVLSNYYTNVKEEEILNFRRIVTQERQRLQSKMRNFELESADIQEKLKENDRAAIEAIVKAEEQVKKRIAKEEELKCLKSQLLKVQAEISRNKIRLHDYQSYQRFLESLVPEPQRSERLNQMKVKQKENMADKENHQKQVQIEQSFAKDVEGITMATSEKSDLQKIFKKSYETV